MRLQSSKRFKFKYKIDALTFTYSAISSNKNNVRPPHYSYTGRGNVNYLFFPQQYIKEEVMLPSPECARNYA